MWEPTVAAVMTREVAAVRPGTPFAKVVAAMAAHGGSAVPLVDVTGMLLGVVSEVESEPRSLPARVARRVRNRRATALSSLDLAVSSASAVRADRPLSDAVRKLADPEVRTLYVVDGRGALVGVVCRSDLQIL